MKELKSAFVIQCPFCSAPYDANMLIQLEEGAYGCQTCGPDSSNLVIEIFCSKCKKLVYKKEGKSYDF